MAGAERAPARSVTDLGVGSSDWLGPMCWMRRITLIRSHTEGNVLRLNLAFSSRATRVPPSELGKQMAENTHCQTIAVTALLSC